MLKKTFSSRRRAFFLLDNAVYIAVALFIGFVAFVSVKHILKGFSHKRSVDNVEAVSQALNRFFAKYGRLPCPADSGSITGTSENCGSSQSIAVSYSGNSISILYGKIPTKTLGISDSLAIDGYGNFISYSVLSSFTSQSLRYYANPSSTELTTAFATQNQPFNDKILADYGSIGETSINANDDIKSFIKILGYRWITPYPLPSSQEIINYANGLDTEQNGYGPIISLDAVYVLVSHGVDGYCAYNASSLSLNQIPANVMQDGSFLVNDYINCINHYSQGSNSALKSRAFVFYSDNDRSQSKYANDIVAFANFRFFYPALIENKKVDCPSKTFTSNNPVNNSSYSFSRAAYSRFPISPASYVLNGQNPSANACDAINGSNYPVSTPSAMCNTNGEWTSFVPLLCSQVPNPGFSNA